MDANLCRKKICVRGNIHVVYIYVIWLVNIASGIMVPLSNAIFGKDTTADWTLFGLKSTQTLGILGVVFIIAVTFLEAKD